MINDPALQAAAGQDATIKTLLDAQASVTTQAEQDAKEREIEPKVKAALKAAQLDSLLKNYKPQFGAALNIGSAGTSGSAGTAAKK
jgi:hypothetical protein